MLERPKKLDASLDSPDGKLRVLSLDGGGFRGLGMLYVLDGITKAANARNRRPTDRQLKPHEIFDIIVGSSTGGLIAVLVGRLGLDCEQAIAEYKALATALFGTSRSAFMEKLLADQKFDAATIERYDAAVAALVAKYSSTPAFYTDPVNNAKTAVSIQPSGGRAPQLVPSFSFKPSTHSSWQIHDVIRATTAAPRYLPPYVPPSAPTTEGFTDAAYAGQTINPTIIGKRYWNENLGVLVNIGQWFPAVQLPTDKPLTTIHAKEFNKTFLRGAPDDPKVKTEETVLTYLKQIQISQKVLNNVQKEHAGVLERLDPPLAPQNIGILELVDIFCEDIIKAEVQRWIADNSARFTEIARKLIKEGVWDEPKPIVLPCIMLPDMKKPLSDPAIPDPNPSVLPYNPVLDAKKPTEMLQYFNTYRVIFIIDDSSSMVMMDGHMTWDPQCTRWRQAQNSIGPIADFTFQHNVSSVDIGFMNYQRDKPYRGIQNSKTILEIFQKAQPPQRWHLIQYTPTGSVLKFYIDKAIRELDSKVNDPEEYKKIRPTDIIVLTDGEADENNHPKPVMVAARQEMDRKRHNHNYLGIQFVQIGDSSLAKLRDLTEGEYGDMADLVLSDGTDLTSEKLTRILLGGIHPTVRGRLRGGSSSSPLPVILIHGLTNVPDLSGSWKLVENFLSDSGMEHFTPSIPTYGGIEERSTALISQIASRYPGATVHLFGHSIGGINARDLASKAMTSNLGFQILTVTTFGTPHRGMKMITNGLSQQLRSILGTDFGLFSSLSPDFMEDYNRKCRNNPSVQYFSWAGVTEVPTPILLPFHAASRIFGPTDGMVNVSSATWDSDLLGPGVHLGTMAGRSQFSIINVDTASSTIPHLKAAQSGTTAPVKSIENNLLSAATRRVDGAVNTVLAPGRAVFSAFGIRRN